MQQLTQAHSEPHRDRPPVRALTFTVVVPTYRRTDQLLACLYALKAQQLAPSQVLVVVRDEDDETRAALAERADVAAEIVPVQRGGQTHALNAALRRATGDVVAFTDDDAVPRLDWLSRLAAHYANPVVGGVGGKVIVPGQTAAGSSTRHQVGSVSSIGRPLGNHHLGDGDARAVQWLKGVNMSYRRELCGFDESLRGAGAQVANDSEIALRIRNAGWTIIYDPAAAVDHYAGPRFDEDARGTKSIAAMRDAVFNETLVLLRWLPAWPRQRAFTYLLLVGVPRGVGPLGGVKSVLTGRRSPAEAVQNCRAATAARIEAWREWRVTRKRKDVTPRAPR